MPTYSTGKMDDSATTPLQGMSPSSSMTGNGGASLGDQASSVTQQAQQKLKEVANTAQAQATNQVNAQMAFVAQSVGDVTNAIQQVAVQLRQNNQSGIADIADRATGQLQRVTTYLHANDVRDVLHDVESYARRQPAIFLTGAFALGLLAARFLKSSGMNTPTPSVGTAPNFAHSATNIPTQNLSSWSTPSTTDYPNMTGPMRGDPMLDGSAHEATIRGTMSTYRGFQTEVPGAVDRDTSANT